jgi:hypothetical protein
MHDAREVVFDYDHDPNFVPSPDELLLFEMLHKQIIGYAAMSLIIIQTMRSRASNKIGRTLVEIDKPRPTPLSSPRRRRGSSLMKSKYKAGFRLSPDDDTSTHLSAGEI